MLKLDDVGYMRVGTTYGPDANDLRPAERAVQVQRARLYWKEDAGCNRGIKIYTSYAISKGFSLKAKKKDAQDNVVPNPAVQKLADAFWKSSRNRKVFSVMGQQESSYQLLHDGELFFALFPPGDIGNTTVVRRLPDSLEIQAVITNPDDWQEVWYYYRVWTPRGEKTQREMYPDHMMRQYFPDGNYPSPSDAQLRSYGIQGDFRVNTDAFIYHCKFGSTGVRGIPMIATAMGWAKAHKEFIEDRIAINRALARFAWFRKIKGAASSVLKLGGNPPNAGVDPSRLPPNQPAGGIMTTNQAVDWQSVNAQSGGGSASVEARMIFLQVCRAMGLPEHFLSDGSNGNRATATEMDRPTQLNLQDYQNLWKEAYEAMFAFEMFEQDQEYDPDIVDVTAPPILEEDSVALSTAIVQLAQVMPELKVTDFYRRALESLNIEDTQDILPEIEQRAEEIQKQQQDQLQQQHDQAMALKTAGSTGGKLPQTPGNRTNGAASSSSDNKQS